MTLEEVRNLKSGLKREKNKTIIGTLAAHIGFMDSRGDGIQT